MRSCFCFGCFSFCLSFSSYRTLCSRINFKKVWKNSRWNSFRNKHKKNCFHLKKIRAYPFWKLFLCLFKISVRFWTKNSVSFKIWSLRTEPEYDSFPDSFRTWIRPSGIYKNGFAGGADCFQNRRNSWRRRSLQKTGLYACLEKLLAFKKISNSCRKHGRISLSGHIFFYTRNEGWRSHWNDGK